MPNPPAREGDEAVSKAASEWLRNYYGSIDAAALLLAFKAGACASNLNATDDERYLNGIEEGADKVADRIRARTALRVRESEG